MRCGFTPRHALCRRVSETGLSLASATRGVTRRGQPSFCGALRVLPPRGGDGRIGGARAVSASLRRARRFIARTRVMREWRRFTPRPRLRAPCRRFGLASCARRSPLRFQNFPFFARFAVNRAAFPQFARALLKRSAASPFFSRKIFSPLDYFDALATTSVIYHRVIRQTSQILQEGRRAG